MDEILVGERRLDAFVCLPAPGDVSKIATFAATGSSAVAS
jgi:hypothetical protein